jgi:hypothetical protein
MAVYTGTRVPRQTVGSRLTALIAVLTSGESQDDVIDVIGFIHVSLSSTRPLCFVRAGVALVITFPAADTDIIICEYDFNKAGECVSDEKNPMCPAQYFTYHRQSSS